MNLSFNPASSVFPDECHEMAINKDMAFQVPARLSNENIETISNYFIHSSRSNKAGRERNAGRIDIGQNVYGKPCHKVFKTF